MKNIPSFKQFNQNYSLLESADSELESLYYDLKREINIDESLAINEGLFGNMLSNWASKTFLGPLGLSKVSYIDKARNIYLGLELDLLKKRDSYESKLEEYSTEMDKLSSEVEADKPRMEAIKKKLDVEKTSFETYVKAQKLKIESAKDIIEAAVDGNERRRSYADAGMAEDKIIIADKEYDYAKKRAKSTEELDVLTDKIKKLRNDLDEKVNKFKKTEEEKSKKEEEITKDQKVIVGDSMAKRIIEKVKGIRTKGIIDITEDLKKDIATLEAERERVEEEMKKKDKAGNLNKNIRAKYKSKIKVIEAETEGRKKQLEVLRGLGKDSITISRNLKNPKKSQEVLDKIAEIDMDTESEKAE
jgi:uncharacterized protein involved in exopolysaccharide biosynthesis